MLLHIMAVMVSKCFQARKQIEATFSPTLEFLDCFSIQTAAKISLLIFPYKKHILGLSTSLSPTHLSLH